MIKWKFRGLKLARFNFAATFLRILRMYYQQTVIVVVGLVAHRLWTSNYRFWACYPQLLGLLPSSIGLVARRSWACYPQVLGLLLQVLGLLPSSSGLLTTGTGFVVHRYWASCHRHWGCYSQVLGWLLTGTGLVTQRSWACYPQVLGLNPVKVIGDTRKSILPKLLLCLLTKPLLAMLFCGTCLQKNNQWHDGCQGLMEWY